VGKLGEMAEHLEKLAGGAIRRATAAIWWKKGVPPGNGAARRRGGDLLGVRDAMEDLTVVLGENGSVSPIGMSCSVFGHSRCPLSPPPLPRARFRSGAPDKKSPSAG
jgi:hypothetical protein